MGTDATYLRHLRRRELQRQLLLDQTNRMFPTSPTSQINLTTPATPATLDMGDPDMVLEGEIMTGLPGITEIMAENIPTTAPTDQTIPESRIADPTAIRDMITLAAPTSRDILIGIALAIIMIAIVLIAMGIVATGKAFGTQLDRSIVEKRLINL